MEQETVALSYDVFSHLTTMVHTSSEFPQPMTFAYGSLLWNITHMLHDAVITSGLTSVQAMNGNILIMPDLMQPQS
jgi:hypothetical protein